MGEVARRLNRSLFTQKKLLGEGVGGSLEHGLAWHWEWINAPSRLSSLRVAFSFSACANGSTSDILLSANRAVEGYPKTSDPVFVGNKVADTEGNSKAKNENK